jgi:N-acetylmuramoyl-L-alanine amidase
MVFLFAALFILLVLEPNLTSGITQMPVKTPDQSETALRTNDDVERQVSQSGALIVIDPGRGGWDTGVQTGSVYEKDLAMQLAQAIGAVLEKDGYRVEYSRWYDDIGDCDTTTACDAARLEKAKELGADYLLSLRFNQDDSLHGGFSIFTQPDNEQLLALSKEIALQLQQVNYSRYEGLDTDHYSAFTTLSDSSVPAVLVQLGYVTNTSDLAKLTNSTYQEKIASAIARAFLNTVN